MKNPVNTLQEPGHDDFLMIGNTEQDFIDVKKINNHSLWQYDFLIIMAIIRVKLNSLYLELWIISILTYVLCKDLCVF